MNEPDPSEPKHVFQTLARLIYSGSTFDEIYQQLVETAPRIVTGCDHASLMLARRDGYETAAASDDVARRIDALERELGEGPCVDAIDEEAGQIDPDITRHSTWPRLAERVIAETPVRGMAGYRIVIEGKKVGALNLFSDTPDAFETDGADQGAVLSAFASVALMSMANRDRADSLRRGLESNREVGKAIGLLMAAHHIGSEEAFEVLRKASNDMNMKLTEVAREVIENAERRPHDES
ncbi:MAG TPA: GAF and ANTAR domain-containing protein [Nocardioides sp.]|nr:GAF and ANTAR domain-containing protein [Nocardioides sp.]